MKSFEECFGVVLFKCLLCGFMLIYEGESLLLVLCDFFDCIVGLLECFEGGYYWDVFIVGVVGIFMVGWLLLWLEDF